MIHSLIAFDAASGRRDTRRRRLYTSFFNPLISGTSSHLQSERCNHIIDYVLLLQPYSQSIHHQSKHHRQELSLS